MIEKFNIFSNIGGTKIMKSVKVEFTEKSMTGNAGLIHFGRFMKKLGLDKILENHLSIIRAENAEYQASDIVQILILSVLAGAKHMCHTRLLRHDGVLRKIFGWVNFPVESTFSRIFKLFTPRHCEALSDAEDQVRRKVWGNKRFGRVTMLLDSSVKGVFGSQEGAAAGYNPGKKGQKSYHPLFCFIAETCECLHNWFRTGSEYSGNGAAEFVAECFARLPEGVWKIFVMADSAFFCGKLMDILEGRGASYLIKVKLRNLTDMLSGQKWRKVRNQPGFEAAEFPHQCSGCRKPRRFVAIRELTGVITKGLLFPKYEYRYFCYVTNDRLSPWKAHKKYAKRAACENWIEWCKNQVAAGSILTDDFRENSAIFQSCVFAYNLKVWLMLLTHGHKIRLEPFTVRYWFISIPGRLLAGSRTLKLKLSENSFFMEKWKLLENAVEQLSFA